MQMNKFTVIMILLQTHARLLFFGLGSIFASFEWTSTKNVWNAKNVMLSRAACVFVPWIT